MLQGGGAGLSVPTVPELSPILCVTIDCGVDLVDNAQIKSLITVRSEQGFGRGDRI